MTTPQTPSANEPDRAAPNPRPRPRPGSRRRSRQRRNRTLVIGAVVGTVLTVGVLTATIMAGGTEDPTPTTTTNPALLTTTTLPAVLTNGVELPDADYTKFCEELVKGVDTSSGTLTPERFIKAITTIDFEALIAAAPEELRPQLELLRDAKPQLVSLMEQVDEIPDLSIEDFPRGVPDAIVSIVRIQQQKC